MESHDTAAPQPESHSRTVRHRRLFIGGAVVLGLIVVVCWAAGLGRYLVRQVKYAGKAATFSGDSQKLKQTVIVPTLDSLCPPGKNVIWCSSFQLAWNELRDKTVKAPLHVVGAEEVAGRLNAARQSSSDLDLKSYYAAGGWIKDGIVGKIKKDMAAKFPSHVLPDFNDYDGGLLAYSYLTANVPFKYPFRQMDNGLTFCDSQGAKIVVEAFGLSEIDESSYQKMREQVAVLYSRRSDKPNRWEFTEYILDLCQRSQPYAVIVAMVEAKGSLADTLEYVRVQTRKSENAGPSAKIQALGRNDILKVPEMIWRIDHRFSELTGKKVANVDMPIVEALQTTIFRLDRHGAVLKSEAHLAVKSLPEEFLFNRPFLVYMQKRGAEHPFFVMWVDNAELLVRR